MTTPARATRMFQITEDDLAALEAIVPQLVDLLYSKMDNALRVKVRQVQRVIVDVRWNYGPPAHVEIIGADSDHPDQRSTGEAGSCPTE